MRVRQRLVELATKPRLPRRTVRLRLTVLYGCLFLVLGIGLVATTYFLVRRSTDTAYVYQSKDGKSGAVLAHDGSGSKRGTATLRTMQTPNAPTLSGVDFSPQQMEAQSKELERLARKQHNDMLHQLLTQSGIALGVTTVVSMALGWVMAGRALRPLRTITSAARNISATNLHERLALDGPDDELKELGETFDDLLERLDQAFAAQRRFVANASHELRTPLARQRTVAQVALADPRASVESLRAAHERVLAAGEQQERLIESLLTLTRGQAGLDRREAFDLAAVTSDVVQARESEATRRGLHVDTSLAPGPTSGNARLVERLIVNLVDNALHHNVPGGRVGVTTAQRDGRCVLSVTNDGPVVPPGDVDRLFRPFQRLEPERTNHREGLGLGLSIVEAIAGAHRATVEARARPAGGLEVEISFACA
jgi:signal transduction histidine kinase